MWALGLLIWQTVGAAAGGAVPQASSATTPVLEVAARQYRGDGIPAGMAMDTGRDHLGGYVWSNETLCAFGASANEPANAPAFGWHFTALIQQRAGDDFVVQVDWQRIWDNATRVASPRNGTVQVKLRQGDRVELDHVVPPATSPCGTAIVRLEVAIATMSSSSVRGSGTLSGRGGGAGGSGGGMTGSGGAAGVRAGGGGGGAGGGTGVLRAMTPGVPSAEMAVGPSVKTDEDLRLRTSALFLALKAQVERANPDASVSARLEELRQLISRPRFDAEVWLVHRLPNGTEDVQRQVATFASRATIAFAAVPVATNRGVVNVDVTSVLQLGASAALPMNVKISRRIKGDGPPPVDNFGGSDRQVEVPKPGDVLSFELPPLVGPTSTLLAGHTFSLRLLLAPGSQAPAR